MVSLGVWGKVVEVIAGQDNERVTCRVVDLANHIAQRGALRRQVVDCARLSGVRDGAFRPSSGRGGSRHGVGGSLRSWRAVLLDRGSR